MALLRSQTVDTKPFRSKGSAALFMSGPRCSCGQGSVQMIRGCEQGSVQTIRGCGQGSVQTIRGCGQGSVQTIRGCGQGFVQTIRGCGQGSVQMIRGPLAYLSRNIVTAVAESAGLSPPHL